MISGWRNPFAPSGDRRGCHWRRPRSGLVAVGSAVRRIHRCVCCSCLTYPIMRPAFFGQSSFFPRFGRTAPAKCCFSHNASGTAERLGRSRCDGWAMLLASPNGKGARVPDAWWRPRVNRPTWRREWDGGPQAAG